MSPKNGIKVINTFQSSPGNSVFMVKNNQVYKEMDNRNSFEREIAGGFLFGVITNCGVARINGIGSNYIISEYLTDNKTAFDLLNNGQISMDEINSDISSFMAEAYRKRKNIISLPKFMCWAERVEEIKNMFGKNKKIANYIGSDKYKNISIDLSNLKNNLNSGYKFNTTLLHRDLHLGNILYRYIGGIRKMYIIDFEHCMEGPIEFEMQNSIFWRDAKSLQVRKITELLKKEFKVPYSVKTESILKPLYLADQLNIAYIRNDKNKLELLSDKYMY